MRGFRYPLRACRIAPTMRVSARTPTASEDLEALGWVDLSD